MATKKKRDLRPPRRIAADNRKARYLFTIKEEMEAGIELVGTEVKALRAGEGNIADSYAEVRGGQLWLVNAHIPEFSHGNRFNHEPRRPRRMLMKRREINRLQGAVERKGQTLVPLRLLFNDRGRLKVILGLAEGKKQHDKREAEKQRDWQRQKQRLLKDHG